MDLILKGIVTGFILSIMVGPVFFVLLETSIRKGIKAAVAFDIGVVLNDIVYIAIAFVFFNQVKQLQSGDDNSVIRLIGGVLFLAYGVFNFLKKVKGIQVENVDGFSGHSFKDYSLLALKGFVLNLANPMVVFYWFSVMTLGAKDSAEGAPGNSMIVFLASILITFFSIDFLKILGAKSLRPLVTDKVLKGLNRLIGIVFVAFGVVLIAQGIIGLTK
ncbi:MAG TPA: LysE family translocator [Crocinitomicaceae bacterium]|nr:LysE family translocator [Crocinitomicaceae bacterium]